MRIKTINMEQAFPAHTDGEGKGLTKREYFMAHLIYEPSKEEIEMEANIDRAKNPHNDSYKPPIRSKEEIIAQLRLRRVDAFLDELSK